MQLQFLLRKMKFSKDKFNKNAPKVIIRQLKPHIDTLDGLIVDFSGKYGKDGYIKQYFINGQEYYLYPIYKEWCIEDDIPEQMNIFDFMEVMP